METLKVDCPKCKGYVVIPVLSADERADFATKLRESASGEQLGTVQQIALIKQQTGFDLADSKRFATHFTDAEGICRKCGRRLPKHECDAQFVICTHCRSLNLDWKGRKSPDEVFPYVNPQGLAFIWDGSEDGWVIACLPIEEGQGQAFVNRHTRALMNISADGENLEEIFATARENGVPEIDFKDIFQ